MSDDVYASVDGVKVISANVTAQQGSACRQFEFYTRSSSYSVNDSVSITMGIEGGASQTVLNEGYIDSVSAERPRGLYHIAGRDKLKKAVDYFIVVASTDKADFFNPRLKNGSTSPSAVIGDILTECGLSLGTSTGDAGWELGNATDGTPFQLVSAWDAIQQVCSIGAWRVWCAANGEIIFSPSGSAYGGGVGFATGAGGNIKEISYSKSDEDLRNEVVVIGENGDYTATASATSSYLPSGFYKTAVISTDLIGNQSAADDTAAANLSRFNKLTEKTSIVATGTNADIYNSASVTESFTSAPGGMIVSLSHTVDDRGYVTEVTAEAV